MREKRNVISQIRYLFTGIFLLFLAVRAHAYDRTIEEAVGIYNHLQGNKLCHISPIGMEIEQGGIDDETVTLTSTNNSLSCKPTGQLRIQIQKPKSGKTYRVKLTKFPAGYTGDTEFLIDESKKVGGISFVVETAYVMPPGTYEVKLLDTTNPINLLPVPATINTLPRDFPAANRSNDDFGRDQVYNDIKNGGKADCGYMDIRYSKNTNSPFYKYFTTPELRDLYEYTAYSDDDLNQIYGGNPNHPSIQWRPLFDVPAGRTVFTDVIYYDLQAHGRKYKDLKTITGRPKFYFRIKGTNCQSSMDAGDMRFMGVNISFLGTCQAPEMTLTAGGSLVCFPISYEIRQGGVKVKEGQFTQAGQEKITILAGGRYFDPNQEYEVTFTSADGQTEIRKDKFSDFYRTVKPDGGYIEQDRCFGSLEPPKGMIRTYFRRNMGGTQFSMNGFKVTLLQAPAAYRDEPGKLKLHQTVTIAYRNPNSVITNIMATQNQDDLEQYFTLPEGIYKIKVEDLCGNVTYLYSRYSVDEFKLQYPSYKEKELTPEVETECTKVKVYPFRGNPAKDWLKINGDEKRIFVYLYKLPTGVNDGEVSVSSGLTNPVGSVFYKKAVYDPKNPSSVDQYFSLPRNQNSVGKYLFVYGGDMTGVNNSESGISKYIQSGGTQGCVRTFEFDVDSALLSFDPDTYKGYRCEDNTGEIRLKAINGMGSIGSYTYELYDVKEGTRIDTKTAPKGNEVVFNSLGTFAAGQSTRWVKITDSECAAAHVWRELPVARASQPNLLLKTPLNSTYCKGEKLVIELQPVGATKYLWTLPDGSTQDTGTSPKLEIPSIQDIHSGIYTVKTEGLICGTNTLTFNYKINVPTLAIPTIGVKAIATCAAVSVAKVANYASYAAGTTFVITDAIGTLVSGTSVSSDGTIIGITTAGAYKVKATKDGCETTLADFQIADKLPTPTVPIVGEKTAETCSSISVSKVTNYTSYAAGTTFAITDVAGTPVSGASVSSDGTITGITTAGGYKIKATNTQGCASVEANFTLNAALPIPATPVVTQVTAAGCGVISTVKVSNYTSYAAGTTFAITDVAGTPISGASVSSDGTITGITTAGGYKIKATNTQGCASVEANFTLDAALPIPATPVVTQVTAAGCGVISTVKVSNYTSYAVGTTFVITDVAGTPVSGASVSSDGTITGITTAGGYKIKATNTQGCASVEVNFTLDAALPIPATPVVTQVTAAGCGVISTVKVSNYTSYAVGTTFAITDVAGTPVSGASVSSDGTITGITTAGGYKIKATNTQGCASVEANFTLDAALPIPATPVVTQVTAAGCGVISTVKVSNYTSYAVGTTFVITDVAGTPVSGASVSSDGTITGITTAGGYKIKATNTQGCASVEANFTLDAALPIPATPVVTQVTAAGCGVISTVKVSNYTSYAVGTTFVITDVAGTPVSGASVSSDGTITGITTAGGYKIKATNTQGCASVEANFTLDAALPIPATPVVTQVTAAGCGVISTVKVSNYTSYAVGTTFVITDVAGAPVSGASVSSDGTITGITTAGSYKVKASKDGCEATLADFQIADKLPIPETPTVMVTPPTCTAISAAKVSNYTDYTHGETFTITDSNGAAIGAVDNAGNITGLTTAGTYTLTITRGTCRAVAVDFDIANVLLVPAKPIVTLTVESCTAATVAKIGNYESIGVTYIFTKADGTPVTGVTIASDGELSGLAAGSYKVKAEKGDCISDISDEFKIKNKKAATIIVTNPQSATYVKDVPATPLTAAAIGEGITYKWYKNTTNSYTGGTEIGGNNTYTPATDTVGSLFYWAEIAGGCGTENTSIVEIKVVETAPVIEAVDDVAISPRGGQVDVLHNDMVGGNPAALTNVAITIVTDGGLTGVTVDPTTGKLKVPSDATPGTYTVTYKICDKATPGVCDTAVVKITVTPDTTPSRVIKAVDDDFGKIPNAVDYTTTNTVFSAGVDTMEGVVGNLSPERDVVLTPGVVTRDGAAITEGITMNPNGSITVKRGTPKGTYTYEYTICQKGVPTNCDKAKVSFEVIEAHIFAKDDGVWEVGTEGALTPSVLNNDILGERVGIAPSEVDIQQTQGKSVIDETKMVMNKDGRISVKKGIAEGPYTYYYTITEKANPSNTSSAKVTIRVVSFSAQDDEFDIINDKTKEYKTDDSVLKNDELNKKKGLSTDDVILKKGEAKDAERNPTTALTMNDDGTITIAPNTPDGIYTYTYTICKKSAPTECKSAEAVIKLLPALIANDDDFTANPINPLVKEGIAGNVLDNDRYADGNALEHLDKVKITMLEDNGSRAYIEPNGNVVIPQGAPAGEYTLTYRLCMKDHPTICAEAKVKIVILEDKPIVIHNGISANGDGVNDGFIIEHIEGYPKNNLKIFNRWGVLVYEKDGYTNSEPFDGHSNGRATISADSKLPQGTYYYILEYQDTAEQTHTEKGWLYLKENE